MTTRWLVSIIGLVLFSGAGSLTAHHAFSSEFDASKPIVLNGTVTKTEWINPHSWIHIDVKGSDGKVASWAIECGAPNSLLRRGLNKTSIPSGTQIVVDGFQAKDGSTTANAKDITLPDGRKFFVGSSGTGAPYEKPEKP
jgi:hypothetical protein